jgi:hypothetical protein
MNPGGGRHTSSPSEYFGQVNILKYDGIAVGAIVQPAD